MSDYPDVYIANLGPLRRRETVKACAAVSVPAFARGPPQVFSLFFFSSFSLPPPFGLRDTWPAAPAGSPLWLPRPVGWRLAPPPRPVQTHHCHAAGANLPQIRMTGYILRLRLVAKALHTGLFRAACGFGGTGTGVNMHGVSGGPLGHPTRMSNKIGTSSVHVGRPPNLRRPNLRRAAAPQLLKVLRWAPVCPQRLRPQGPRQVRTPQPLLGCPHWLNSWVGVWRCPYLQLLVSCHYMCWTNPSLLPKTYIGLTVVVPTPYTLENLKWLRRKATKPCCVHSL